MAACKKVWADSGKSSIFLTTSQLPDMKAAAGAQACIRLLEYFHLIKWLHVPPAQKQEGIRWCSSVQARDITFFACKKLTLSPAARDLCGLQKKGHIFGIANGLHAIILESKLPQSDYL